MRIANYLSLGFEFCAQLELFARDLANHIVHARTKHRFFAQGVSLESVETLGHMADIYRQSIRRPGAKPDVQSVLQGELYEFLEALKKGDRAAAREEALDVMAVMWRALDGEHEREVAHE